MIKVSHRCGTFFVYDAATAIKRLHLPHLYSLTSFFTRTPKEFLGVTGVANFFADARHNKKTSTDVEVSRILLFRGPKRTL